MQRISQFGRSMIEMLGVLAITGVLLIGGISGYSKAMSVYKLNKWIYQIREMIANARILYINQKAFGEKVGDNMLDAFISGGIILRGMLNENKKDMFGNYLSIEISNKKSVVDALRVSYRWFMSANKNAVECCAKLYELANYYDSLWLVAIENDFSYTNCGKSAPLVYVKDQKCQAYNFMAAKTHCKKCEKQKCTMLLLLDNSSF